MVVDFKHKDKKFYINAKNSAIMKLIKTIEKRGRNGLYI